MRRSRVLTFFFSPVFFSSPIFFVFFISSPSPSLSRLSFSRRSLNHSDPHRSVLVLCKYLKYYNVDSFYFFLLFLLAMATYRFYLLFRREMFTNIVNFSFAVIWTDFFFYLFMFVFIVWFLMTCFYVWLPPGHNHGSEGTEIVGTQSHRLLHHGSRRWRETADGPSGSIETHVRSGSLFLSYWRHNTQTCLF